MEGGNSMLPLQSNLEAKLLELLHKINSAEVKLVSAATKEFAKLLKSDSVGEELLKLYVKKSPNLSELAAAWKLRDGNPIVTFIIKLISVILNHPKGKYSREERGVLAVSSVLDKFAKTIVEQKLDTIYRELRSKDVKRQNAALLLMTSVVKRGAGMASELEKNFNFKLPGFSGLATVRKRNNQKRTTRKAFVRFAMSFIEEGKPWLIRKVLRHREMYSGVLRGLGDVRGSDEGEDVEDDVIIHVLSTLRDKVLTDDSTVSPALRSVLFGSETLEKLVGISGREEGDLVTELAHQVLIMVCTNPRNGLMPDMGKRPIPLKGNLKRILGLMKKLRATENANHRSLVLAIVDSRPRLGSAYLEDFPYNVDDYGSPTWFGAMNLASEVVRAIGKGNPFDFLIPLSSDPPALECPNVQDVLKCVSPRPFGRSVVNKGLLHVEFLVQNATLRFILECLKLLELFYNDINSVCSISYHLKRWQFFKQEILNEVRVLLPDSQVLLAVFSSLSNQMIARSSRLKRKGEQNEYDRHPLGGGRKKKSRMDTDIDDSDIIVAGVESSLDASAAPDNKDDARNQVEKKENGLPEFAIILSRIWGSSGILESELSETDAEYFFLSKLMDVFKIILVAMPAALEGSFELFMNQLTTGLILPAYYQISILSLLVRFVRWCSKSGNPISTPPMMYKHMHVYLSLSIFSPIDEVKVEAFSLARAAMSSTGAFDHNSDEMVIWLYFLPGCCSVQSSMGIEGVDLLRLMSSASISFLCDAISTTGNSLFKFWDSLKAYLSKDKVYKDTTPTFGPLVVCVLQKCLRILNSNSGSLSSHEKYMTALYVSSTIKCLLQTQVDAGVLAYLINAVVAETLQDNRENTDKSFEWRPIRNLRSFAMNMSHCNSSSIVFEEPYASPLNNSFKSMLDEVQKLLHGKDHSEISRIAIAYSSTIAQTTIEDMLQNFPSFMALSSSLRIPSPFLSFLIFSERGFLSGILDCWSSIFWRSMDLAISANETQCEDNNELLETEVCDNTSLAASGFSLILRTTPFHMLLPAIFGLNISKEIHVATLQKFLMDKLSSCKNCFAVTNMRLVLFWLQQLYACFRDSPSPVLEQHAEICCNLALCILDKVSSDYVDVIAPLAETILRHPLMYTMINSPCIWSEELMSESSLENVDAFTAFIDIKIHRMHRSVINILRNACHSLNTAGDNKLTSAAYAILSSRYSEELQEKMENVKKTKDVRQITLSFYGIHSLAEFISPFRLLELGHYILSAFHVADSTQPEPYLRFLYSVGCCLVSYAFRFLFLHKMNNLWRQEEEAFDLRLVEEVYAKICTLASVCRMDIAYCSLADVVASVYVNVFKNSTGFRPLSCALLQVVARTPLSILSSCIHGTNQSKAKTVRLLVEMSVCHSSAFGRTLREILSEFPETMTGESFLQLLPAALPLAKSSTVVASCFSALVWKTLVKKGVNYGIQDELNPSSWEELAALADSSVLGMGIQILMEQEMTLSDKVEHCTSVLASSSVTSDMLDSMSMPQQTNAVVGIVAKVKLFQLLLFSAEDAAPSLTKLYDLKVRILKDLIRCWRCVVENLSSSQQSQNSRLYRCLDLFILTTVADMITNMRNTLSQLGSISFLGKFLTFALRYRFEDLQTLRAIRKIVMLLSEGSFPFGSYLQLVLSHSQFPSTICLVTNPQSSGFAPISTLLGSAVFSQPHEACCSSLTEFDEGKLELIKLLILLYHLSSQRSCELKDIVNLEQFCVLLLSSYGATCRETDLEILSLMKEIKASNPLITGVLGENDYLWGAAVSNARKDRALCNHSADSTTVDEFRRRVFRDNFPLDPRICASTVLHLQCNLHESGGWYHPEYVLRFSLHALSRQYLEPVEFASLGLLALAFASLSSREIDTRKSGYEFIGRYKQYLEDCPKKKDLMQLRLLLAYIQNGIEEPWQKIPSIVAIFAAESSIALLDSSHELHASLSKHFLHTSRVNLKGIPLFDTIFESSSSTFRAERVWILRLLHAGLNSEDDSQIAVRTSAMPRLLSFFVSCLADKESRELILQILKKSAKLPKISRHLVEQCGFLPWASSVVISSITSILDADHQVSSHQLILILQTVVDVVSSRHTSEWLRNDGLEQLMELSGNLRMTFAFRAEILKAEPALLQLVFQVIFFTQKLSQKRRLYQPHLTFSFEFLSKISRISSLFDSFDSSVNRFGIEAILMSTPPSDILDMDREDLANFLKWSSGAASKHEDIITKQPNRAVGASDHSDDEPMLSKLLRWIVAGVFLAKLSKNRPRVSGVTAGESDSKKTLQVFVESFAEDWEKNCAHDETLSPFLLHLQQLLGSRNPSLPSVVALLCIFCLPSFRKSAENARKLQSLCSKIRFPPEANRSWKWSYYQPWRDLSTEFSEAQKTAEVSASQALLVYVSSFAGKTSQLLSPEDVELSGVFEVLHETGGDESIR